MLIRITRSIAMVDISPKPGDVIDRPDDEALALIAAGHAEPVENNSSRGATETARRTGAETRAKRRPRRGGSSGG